MSEEFIYDEDDAVKFIRKEVSQSLSNKISDAEILYCTDVISEYYNEKFGSNVESNDDNSINLDIDDMGLFLQKTAHKDEIIELSSEESTQIIESELDYSESIGITD